MRRLLQRFFSLISLRKFALLGLSVLVLYGAGRLYFQVTGGFREANIVSDLRYNPRWITRSLIPKEQEEVNAVLSQEFHYLGKGCQSYAFVSDDGKYVLKFLKYQRFRPQQWLEYFAFIPPVNQYLIGRLEHKRKKLEGLFRSWRTAFDHLKEESALLLVHLNKTNDLNPQFTFYDKIGMRHVVNIGQYEFLLQRRATMICDYLDECMLEDREEEAKQLLTDLVLLISSEYAKGLADNDHALMQNTGVIDGRPVHVDVGQFVVEPKMKDPAISNQEFFNKFYKFRLWLEEKHPSLLEHMNQLLVHEIGPEFYEMQHRPKDRMEDEV